MQAETVTFQTKVLSIQIHLLFFTSAKPVPLIVALQGIQAPVLLKYEFGSGHPQVLLVLLKTKVGRH